MRGLLSAAGLTLICLTATLAADPAANQAAEDPWIGKHRAKITNLLGEPTKSKKTDDGGETLTYKLLRLDENVTPGRDIIVLHVPGVGLVGKKHRPDSAPEESIEIEPSGLDGEGRMVGGGLTTENSSSRTWDPKTGEKTGDWPERDGKPATRGKFKLQFVLDPNGIVIDWSTLNKKK